MLTLIVPVRNWPQERVDFCVEGFRALSSKTLSEMIVVDFGSAVPVTAPGEDVRVLRLESDRWSSGEAINAGVAIARNEVIAKVDADILVRHDGASEFDRLARAVGRGQIGLAIAQATDLPPELSAAEAWRLISNGETPSSGRLRAKWGQGGLAIFSRATWDAVGGVDGRFTGWGNEDNDFAERVRRSGRRLVWADRRLEAFHVWHPPTYAATGVISHRLRNQKIAHEDKSVLRPITFGHSDFTKIAAPAVLKRISPLVTLGIATTARPNRDRMITEAINSFRDQIDNDFEVLVVDNGSLPEEAAQLQRTLERIRWTDAVRLEVLADPSIPGSRNAISRLARGRYICVVDDDDIALPNRLADHLKPFAADGQVHGSHGGWIDFDESTGVIERNKRQAAPDHDAAQGNRQDDGASRLLLPDRCDARDPI